MAKRDVRGRAETFSVFDRLPSAAQEELAVEMGIIGRELLAAQRADVPKDTGALSQDLGLRVLLERLQLRVGLLRGARDASKFNGRTRKALAGGPFYGRFVEFGRRAQTVLVTRRLKVARRTGNNRKGNNRRTIYAGKPYRLRVKAAAPRPFVMQPLLRDVVERHLADFWANALARAGGAA